VGVVAALADHGSDGPGIGPLPFSVTPLIGRDSLVAGVAERLTLPEIRLLTLVGPGGIGKTRLGLEVAHAVREHFPDGAHLVRLASVSDPSLVPVMVARVLEVRGPIDDPRAWAIVRDRPGLLVLDNFEQLLDAALSVVDVLTHCPHITILVTSRVPLHITGEHQHQVPPLRTPSEDVDLDLATLADTDAIRLFIDRALAVDPEFRLTPDNAGAVVRIVRQLDGLPLAIEPAAARSKHFSAQSIVDRLALSSEDLRGGAIDRPPHQRALRNTIAMDHVGKCSRSLGDRERAWACHRESLAWRRKVGDPRGMAVWLEAMAGLLASCDAFEEAACVLGAVESLRERGAFPVHTHERAQIEPTVTLIRTHLNADRLAASWARGSLMGLPPIVDLVLVKAERAVSALGAAPPAQPPAVPVLFAGVRLTPREQHVVQLLVQRLSDKEIATRLSISPRTASTHVTAILGKLGVRSRHDVARLAARAENGADAQDQSPSGST